MKKIFSLFIAALCCASMWADGVYTVVGEPAAVIGAQWNTEYTDNDMSLVSGTTYRLVKEATVTGETNVGFKVCVDHGWGTAYPSDNQWFTLPKAGDYRITFTFDSESHAVGYYYEEINTEMTTLYFVNTGGWDDANVKAFVKTSVGDIAYKPWSGETMTKTNQTTLNGYAIYSYTFPSAYDLIEFSNDGSNYTGGKTWSADKPYYSYNMGRWYAAANQVPKYHIILNGTFSGDWADADGPFEESVTAESVSYTLKNLPAKTTYTFGVKHSGTWNNLTANITYTNTSAYLVQSGSNPTIETMKEGDYVFTYYYDDNLLVVTYPVGWPTAIDNTVAGEKAVKRVINGQLIIERDGKMYNALGAEVK